MGVGDVGRGVFGLDAGLDFRSVYYNFAFIHSSLTLFEKVIFPLFVELLRDPSVLTATVNIIIFYTYFEFFLLDKVFLLELYVFKGGHIVGMEPPMVSYQVGQVQRNDQR